MEGTYFVKHKMRGFLFVDNIPLLNVMKKRNVRKVCQTSEKDNR